MLKTNNVYLKLAFNKTKKYNIYNTQILNKITLTVPIIYRIYNTHLELSITVLQDVRRCHLGRIDLIRYLRIFTTSGHCYRVLSKYTTQFGSSLSMKRLINYYFCYINWIRFTTSVTYLEFSIAQYNTEVL